MKRIILPLLLAIFAISAQTGISQNAPGSKRTPTTSEVMSRDSIHILRYPAPKVSFDYSDVMGDRTVTVYSDSVGNPLLAIENCVLKSNGRFMSDTTLLSSEGLMLKHSHLLTENGRQIQYRTYVVEKPETFWKPDFTRTNRINENIVGENPDNAGNWTEAHNYYGDSGIDQTPCLKREISYAVTPEEVELVNRYTLEKSEITSGSPDKVFNIGLILLALGIAAALTATKISGIGPDTRRYLAGPAVGALTSFGLYFVWRHVFIHYGTTWGCALCILYIAAYALYHRNIAMKLEDDRSLSNSEATIPIILTILCLLFNGWSIGAETWGQWWAALLTAIFFTIPVMSKPDRGQRCAKCHRIGTIVNIGEIDLGITTEVKEERYSKEVLLVRERFRKFRPKYKCTECYYEYLGQEQSTKIEREVLKRMPVAQPPKQRPKASQNATAPQSSSGDKWPASIGCMYYGYPADGGFPGCLRFPGMCYPCNFEDDYKSCPHKRTRL